MGIIDSFKTWAGKYTTKAANIEVQNSSAMQLVIGNQVDVKPLNPKELVKMNVNWVYACNNRIAYAVATNELKLYAVKNKNKNIINQNRAGKVSKSINLSDDENVVEILDHPFLDLMKNVNDSMNYFDFASWVQSYLGLIGNAYVLVIKNNNVPVALEPLLGEDITIVLDKPNGKIIAYKYKEKINYAPEDIIHFVNYSPGSRVSGKGELEGCLAAAQLYDYYNLFEQYLCKNNARPDFALTFNTLLTEKEQRDLEKIIRKKFGGKNAGMPLIAGGDAKVTPLGLAPREMQFEKGREWCKKEILSSYGVPDSLLTLSESNWASAKEAIRIFNELTIYPKLTQYCEKMNEKLLPLYDDNANLFCWYNVIEDETDPVKQSTVLKTYVDAGIMTVNEAREQLMMEPMKEEPKTAIEQIDLEDEDESTRT